LLMSDSADKSISDSSYVYQPSNLMQDTIKILSDSKMIKALYLSAVRLAQQEVLLVFPTTNAIRREEHVGIFNELRRAAKRGVSIRILTPEDAFVKAHLDELRSNGIIVKRIEVSVEAKFKLLIVDKKMSLVVETKDDSQGAFEQAVGLAIFSNSRATVMPYAAIFASFWKETELYEQARESDKIKEEFVSIAAHELRNPISPILSCGDFAKEELQKIESGNYDKSTIDSLKDNLNVILRNAARLYKLSEDILQASRIESGTFALNIEEADLRLLLSLAIEDANKKAEVLDKNISISIEYMPRSLSEKKFRIFCDSSKIGQVLHNLLDNALRFTPSGGNIKLLIGMNKENEIQIKVQDSGPGIDPSVKDKLFEKFASRSDGGTGLGLFLSKKIITAHGGNIWASNDPSDGAVFSFTLPSDLQLPQDTGNQLQYVKEESN
jgi:two-component system, OmpR family, sensor histidine kinase VicK